MDTATQKRLVEDIVESEVSGELATALQIHEIQVAAANFVDGFSDPNKASRPPLWDVIDYHEIPRDFFELCQRVAAYEVRL